MLVIAGSLLIDSGRECRPGRDPERTAPPGVVGSSRLPKRVVRQQLPRSLRSW